MNSLNRGELSGLGDDYSRSGYEKAYFAHFIKDLRKKMGQLFLVREEGCVLAAGCGTGGMFQEIIQRIRPAEIWAVDWSEEMSTKAQIEARRLQDKSNTHFEFLQIDITKPLFWPDNAFDAAVSNLASYYLPTGWKEHTRELYRCIKRGRYLYLSTFLAQWDFSNTERPMKLAIGELLRSPMGILYGIRFNNIAAKIAEEIKKSGAEYPALDELVGFLRNLGFREIRMSTLYWGFGLALRAKKPL